MTIAKRLVRTVGPRTVGMATPERAAHAPDGIDREALSHNKDHIRARIRAPMQLHAAANNRLAREAAEREALLPGAPKSPQDDQPEPRYRLTRLDMRFDADDGRILRWAISQYVEDHIAVARRGGGSDSGKVDGAQVPGSRVPFNEHQRHALARIAFVNAHVADDDLAVLQAFVEMMAPVNGHREPRSIPEFMTGMRGEPRSRRLEYAFVEIIWELARRLHEVYQRGDFPERIEIGTREDR
jgi:hypothetical protein